jgi:hypothetical protein
LKVEIFSFFLKKNWIKPQIRDIYINEPFAGQRGAIRCSTLHQQGRTGQRPAPGQESPVKSSVLDGETFIDE